MEPQNQSINQTPQPMMEQPVGKNKNLPLIIILAALAVAGVGFGGFELWQKNKNLCIECDGTINEDNKEVNNFSTGDAEVRALIKEISKVADDYVGTHLDNTFDEFMPRWKIPGTDIFVDMEKSYGVDSGVWMHNKEIENKLFSVHEPVEDYLEKNGYVRKEGPYPLPVYYNEQKQIVCEVEENSEPWVIGCSKTDWFSEDIKQLAIELSEAANGSYLRLTGVEIINSSVTPYQRLIAGGFARHLFYRTSPTAKWQFIDASQDFVDCNKFNDDAKKAYKGERCWDYINNIEKTL